MDNREYLEMIGEGCSADIKCEDCTQKEKCRQDIEQEHGVKIPK